MIRLFYYKHNLFDHTNYIRKTKINFCELTFLLRGQMEYIVNGEKSVLHSGDIIYLPPNSYRERKDVADCDYVSFNFHTDAPPALPTHMQNCINSIIGQEKLCNSKNTLYR